MAGPKAMHLNSLSHVMFWYPFIFRRHSPHEPAEIACDYDNEQGALFFFFFNSAGTHGKLRKAKLTVKK